MATLIRVNRDIRNMFYLIYNTIIYNNKKKWLDLWNPFLSAFIMQGNYPTGHCGNYAYSNSMGQSSLNVWSEMFDPCSPSLYFIHLYVGKQGIVASLQLWLVMSKGKVHCSTSLFGTTNSSSACF